MPAAATRAKTKPPAPRKPVVVALETLAKLAGQGVPAQRMTGATLVILADWRAEGIEPGDLRERLEVLAENLEAGQEAAQDAAAEAETAGDRTAAERQIKALGAVRELLVAEAAKG